MAHTLHHLATRVFGVPLMIHQRKLDVIIGVLGPRLAPTVSTETAPAAVGPGDPKERKDYFVTGEGIAVINIAGTLVRRSSWLDAYSGICSYEDIENEFLDAATDPDIKGILLDIDSPGGEVGGCFDLVDQMFSQRGSKPIYAIANDDLFSAAYAIGSAADRIYITRTGGAGSIGVIAAHLDMSSYDEKQGLKYTFVYAGSKKNDFNPHKELTDDEESTLQDEIDRLYDLFCQTVARNRNMSVDSVRNTEAGLYFGPNAVSAGLVDQVGTKADAIAALANAIANPRRVYNIAGTSVAAKSAEREVASVAETPAPADQSRQQQQQQAAAPATPPPSTTTPATTESAATASFTAEDATEVIELCALAGKDLKTAQGYIAQKMKPAEVRKALAAERAAQTDQNPIRSNISPGMSTSTQLASAENNPLVQAAQRRADAARARQTGGRQ